MHARPILTLRGLAFAGATSALLSLGCASKPTPGGPGTYRGVLVNSTEIGTMEVTVGEASSGPLSASGTIDLGDTAVSLSGTLDRSNTKLSLSSTDSYQLTGDSRPAYLFGSYQSPQDMGSFALFLEGANSGPVRLFCGSFVWTAPSDTAPIPFAVAAVPSGSAICVGPDFIWFGNLDANDSLSCESGGSLAFGNVNSDAGNRWGTGKEYGSWAVGPCGGGAANGPDGGSSGAVD